jgi:hypothetical protein
MTPLNQIVLTLLEAQVSLYASDANGNPTGAAIWSGQPAERLQVRERWIVKETRPSGAAYPRQHPLVAQYQIGIERLWALPVDELIGFQPDGETYVLDIVWTEEDTQAWHRRTFYGVTIASRDLESRDIESGHTDGQEFAAQYFIPGSGGGVAPTAGPPPVAYATIWNGTDGRLPLYTFDPVNGFAEVTPGNAASRVTVAEDGSAIQFAGSSSPVLQTTSCGVTVASFHDQFPTTLPRLEFWFGTQLVAAVTPDGLWVRSLDDGALPAATTGQFVLEYQGTPAVLLGAGLAQSPAWMTTT